MERHKIFYLLMIAIDHNEKDGGMYILPECITNIKSKFLNEDDMKSSNDEKF